MRTIQTKVYSFDELTDEAKENAINNIRQKYYQGELGSADFGDWAVDDCGLFEPSHKELDVLFGKDYDFPLLENTRGNIYFSLDRNWFIDVSNAMKVTNDEHFLLWLGIKQKNFEDENGFSTLAYKIGEDTIEFESTDWNIDFTDEQEEILQLATEKFEDHCESILRRIEADIDYRYTDVGIIEDIECNEYEFTENGDLY